MDANRDVESYNLGIDIRISRLDARTQSLTGLPNLSSTDKIGVVGGGVCGQRPNHICFLPALIGCQPGPGAIGRHGVYVIFIGYSAAGTAELCFAPGLGVRRPSTCGENSPVLIPAEKQVAKLCFLAKSEGSPFGHPLLTRNCSRRFKLRPDKLGTILFGKVVIHSRLRRRTHSNA